MNGFGRGGGRRRNAGGYGAAYPGRTWSAATAPSGYRYLGSCRCGYGPNAYYQDSCGQVVSAAGLFGRTAWPLPIQTPSEMDQFRVEKAALERQLRDIEARLNTTPE